MKVEKDDYTPILKTKKEINKEAKDTINEERSGKQLGLKCRFDKLNVALGKYFRFNKVILLAGLSGHCKSTLLTLFLKDFMNKELNGNFKDDIVIVHNSYEMMPVDEVLRVASTKVNKSHLNLLSAEFDKDLKKYNTISDEEFKIISDALDEDEELDHYYFEEPTNIQGLLKNIECAYTFYKEKYNKTDNDKKPKFIIALDHTLLINPAKGESTLDLMARLGKISVFLKKRGYMVFLIGQLNGEIEKPERLKNVNLHYPIKSDIYAQGQLYNACDIVLTSHQPEYIGILEYGVKKFNTSGLLHLQVLKQRFGKIGSIWLKNDLTRGQIIQYEPKSNSANN